MSNTKSLTFTKILTIPINYTVTHVNKRKYPKYKQVYTTTITTIIIMIIIIMK